MRKVWLSPAIGFAAALLLLAAGFFLWEPHGAFAWLSPLAFGPGDWLFPFVDLAHSWQQGEGFHHGFVLLVSLITWSIIFAAVVHLLSPRKQA